MKQIFRIGEWNGMGYRTQSDLACESFGREASTASAIKQRVDTVAGFRIGRMHIQTQEEADALGSPVGRYVTVECGQLGMLGDESMSTLVHLLAGELRGIARRLTDKAPNSEFSIFVAGLGNAELTADAIGPMTVKRLTATRHLREHENRIYRSLGCSALSALAPGVLGQTGIETREILRSAVEVIRPDMMLVIDALAARSCERLATTVQLTDVGIVPGSGVGNHRAAITRESMGVPVAVVGVPTVVNSATLVYDALQKAGIEEIGQSLESILHSGESFFVSPKESDLIADRFSNLLAKSIGTAFTADL